MANSHQKHDMSGNKLRDVLEVVAKYVFFSSAFIAVLSVAAIAVFVFYSGLQPFFVGNKEGTYPLLRFLTESMWQPTNSPPVFGIFYMMLGSIFATTGAILIGVPIGLFTAIYIAELAHPKVAQFVKPAVELLAGIPSVLYGVFGLGVIVPSLMTISPTSKGQSLLAVVIVLAIMILPTVIAITENAIRTVPSAYREGSYALGASKIYTIFKVIIPAAKSGILAGVVLGVGRAIGETMAVMLVAGNPFNGIPSSLWDPVRPLTTNIAMDMGYAEGLHREMLFATGVVLFVFIIIINLILNKITSKGEE